MESNGKKTYLFFDIFFICFFVIIFVWALVDYRMLPFYVRGIFILLGFALIYSRALNDVSIVERALYWISQNVMVPRTKYNHIFGGLFFLLIGILSFLFPPSHERDESFRLVWGSLIKDPSFWILVMLCLIFNLLSGFYMSKKSRQKD